MSILDEQWEIFEATVIGEDAGMVQRMHMRRAFYAGAVSYGAAVGRINKEIDEGAISEAEGQAKFGVMNEELSRFSRELKAGLA